MKKIIVCLFFSFLFLNASFAQKVAFVDMDRILTSIPEYNDAQVELEQQAEKWRQEITKKYEEVEKLYQDYQTREPLMSDEARIEAEENITTKEEEVRQLQRQRFGPEGDLFKKRQSLVKPIQEQVYTTIEKIAKDQRYDFIFTAPDGSSVIYANPDKDLTDRVIQRLNN